MEPSQPQGSVLQLVFNNTLTLFITFVPRNSVVGKPPRSPSRSLPLLHVTMPTGPLSLSFSYPLLTSIPSHLAQGSVTASGLLCVVNSSSLASGLALFLSLLHMTTSFSGPTHRENVGSCLKSCGGIWAGEMTQQIKRLLHEHGDPSPDPQAPQKPPVWWHVLVSLALGAVKGSRGLSDR